MLDSDWNQIKFFKPSENWGDISKLDLSFIQLVDNYRAFINEPMIVTCGTQGQHVANSAHYNGYAADFVFQQFGDNTLLDLFINALRFDFTGIGIYPTWTYKGEIVGGIHLEKVINNLPVKKLWIGIGDCNSDMKYLPVTHKNLEMNGII